MPEIKFSDHALNQLKQRNISKREAEKVLKDPIDIEKKGKFRRVAQGWVQFRNKKYLLRVIYDKQEKVKEVVTCYRTSKFKKYLK